MHPKKQRLKVKKKRTCKWENTDNIKHTEEKVTKQTKNTVMETKHLYRQKNIWKMWWIVFFSLSPFSSDLGSQQRHRSFTPTETGEIFIFFFPSVKLCCSFSLTFTHFDSWRQKSASSWTSVCFICFLSFLSYRK